MIDALAREMSAAAGAAVNTTAAATTHPVRRFTCLAADLEKMFRNIDC
jgi:hypothetical protein